MKKISYEILSKYRGFLMGLSTLLIVVFHLGEQRSNHAFGYNRFFELYCRYISSSAVDIFLIVSGIGLYFAFKKNNNLKDFYLKRYIKIFVPYVTICLVASLFRFFYFDDPKSILSLICNYSFINLFRYGERWFWYIFAISFCYLIFPSIYNFFNSDNKETRLTRFVSLITFLFIIFEMLSKHSTFIFSNIEIFLLRIPSFILGVYLGKKVYDKEPIKVRDIIIMLLNLLLVFTVVRSKGSIYKRPLLTIIIMSSMFLGLIIFDYIRKLKLLTKISDIFVKVLEFVGKYSLEIYLIHVILINLANKADIEIYRYGVYGIMILITFVLAFIYNFINNKIINIITPKINLFIDKYIKI